MVQEKYHYISFINKLMDTHSDTIDPQDESNSGVRQSLISLIHTFQRSRSHENDKICPSDIDTLLHAETLKLINTAYKCGWAADYKSFQYLDAALDKSLKVG